MGEYSESKNLLVREIIWVQNDFGFKKRLGPKILFVQTISGPQNFAPKKLSCKKIVSQK